MMAEVMGETQNPGHVTTAHLGSLFPNLAVERGCFFDNEDTRFGSLPLEDQRRRRAGKRAADDHDIVIEIHRSNRMDAASAKRKKFGRRGR